MCLLTVVTFSLNEDLCFSLFLNEQAALFSPFETWTHPTKVCINYLEMLINISYSGSSRVRLKQCTPPCKPHIIIRVLHKKASSAKNRMPIDRQPDGTAPLLCARNIL